MQKFAWGGGGANLGYLKNEGAELQEASGEHWKTMFKN